MIFILIAISFFLSFSSNYTTKKLQLNMPLGNIAFGLYTVVTSLVAGISYLAMAKFDPCLNGTVILMSFIYSIICVLYIPVNFASLKHNGIFLGSIFSMAGSNVLPMITSYILFREKQSYATMASALCILVASSLPMINKKKEKKLSPVGLFCAVMLLLISGLASTIVKITSELCGSESVLTLNFMTNVFMLFLSLLWILFLIIKEKNINQLKEFRPFHYIMTFIIAFSGALAGYIATRMYAMVDVVPSIVISASVSTLVTVTASLVYREKFRKRYILCIILSLTSTILPAVFN